MRPELGRPYSAPMTSTKASDAAGRKIVAHVLTALLVADIAGAAARLAVPALLGRTDNEFQVAMDVKPIVVLSRIVFAATVVVFLIWFFDARVDAEGSGWRQRRARAWAFWGWIIPIADLWIPFQIMGDIWRAYLPASRRDKIAWLPLVGWVSWLLTGLRQVFAPWPAWPSHKAGYGLELAPNWDSFCMFAVAGIALIAIIQIVSHRRSGTYRRFAARLAGDVA
jgi:hypothetical protein